MTIAIDFSPALLEQLRARSHATGKDLPTIIREAVENDLRRNTGSISAALRPIQDAIAESGVSHDDAERLFEDELRSLRAERTGGRP